MLKRKADLLESRYSFIIFKAILARRMWRNLWGKTLRGSTLINGEKRVFFFSWKTHKEVYRHSFALMRRKKGLCVRFVISCIGFVFMLTLFHFGIKTSLGKNVRQVANIHQNVQFSLKRVTGSVSRAGTPNQHAPLNTHLFTCFYSGKNEWKLTLLAPLQYLHAPFKRLHQLRFCKHHSVHWSDSLYENKLVDRGPENFSTDFSYRQNLKRFSNF